MAIIGGETIEMNTLILILYYVFYYTYDCDGRIIFTDTATAKLFSFERQNRQWTSGAFPICSKHASETIYFICQSVENRYICNKKSDVFTEYSEIETYLKAILHLVFCGFVQWPV